MDDDDEDDQLHLFKPKKRGTNDGCKVHQHHDAVVIDQEGEHVAQEDFVVADVLEGFGEMFERNREQGFTIRDRENRADFVDTKVHRQR